MGATNCPETPRQRMIGMMYLVLTALLALNVSKEILDSFLIVNESLIVTNENFAKKVDGMYGQFKQQLAINENKVKPFFDKAMQAQKYTKEMIEYIEQVKAEVIAKESGESIESCRNIDLRAVTARDKYDESTHYFIGDSQDGSKGKARELREKIDKYKEDMLNLIDAKYRASMNLGLDTKGPYYDADKDEQNWEMHNFYHTILAADVVILNKLIAEIKNAEYDVVAKLYSSVKAEDFTFDQIGAKVVAKSNYILTGENFEADIFVAAYDTKQNPEIIIGAGVDSVTKQVQGPTITVEGLEGVGKLSVPAGGPGLKQYGGVIKVPKPTGTGFEEYVFSGEYVVAAPSATISPTKMNVFYIGVDNPVSISVPGVPNEKVRVSITGGGGSIAKTGNGIYNVRVTSMGECNITVSADLGGSSRSMGSMKFRVKRVPDPVAYVGGVKGGPIAKGTLLAAGAVVPILENFDFDLQFVITSFTFTINVAGDLLSKQTTGNKFTSEMITLINKANRGQRIFIEDIKAKGPDGTTRNLSSIALKLS